MKDVRPPAPTRALSDNVRPANDADAPEDDDDCAPAEVNPADLIPRTDFG